MLSMEAIGSKQRHMVAEMRAYILKNIIAGIFWLVELRPGASA